MTAVIINAVLVIIGGTIGCLCKKAIPKRITDAIMAGVGLCIIAIGITGILDGKNILVAIISIVLGAVVGSLIDIDKRLTSFGDWMQNRFKKNNDGNSTFSEGLVTASLLFCVGSMAIVGSLNAGISKDYEMLLTKSVIDFISAMMLAVSLGYGVIFSSVFVLVYQGAIVLLSELLSEPLIASGAVPELNCVGSLLIMGLGLNMIKVTKIKVANYLPALVFVPFVNWLFVWLSEKGIM